jgi:ATP-dependent DNA helicase RecQ
MVQNSWRPEPFPTWVTCVPSQRHPILVLELAKGFAKTLKLPLIPCIKKLRPTRPQKEMQNSYQQAQNLAGTFAVKSHRLPAGPVFLVDDVVDSRWTMTVVAALLREAGVEAVLPVALAVATATE